MELFYRPNEDDDWGQIRDDTGRLFAVVSVPMSIDQLNEHRRNKTDPYKDLADRLIWTYADPASQFALNASLIEERDRLRARITFFDDHPECELSNQGGWDDDGSYWVVHAVHGGRNDREWHERGRGDTAADAIDAAIAFYAASLSSDQQKEG